MSLLFWKSFDDGRPDTNPSPVQPGDEVRELLATWQNDPGADTLFIKTPAAGVLKVRRKVVH